MVYFFSGDDNGDDDDFDGDDDDDDDDFGGDDDDDFDDGEMVMISMMKLINGLIRCRW